MMEGAVRARAPMLLAAAVLALCATLAPSARAQLEVGTYEGVRWPIVPPPITGPLPPPVRWSGSPPPPATAAGQRVLDVITRVRETLRETAYEHTTRVRERDGVYRWDCSGMVAWMLRRAAPVAMRRITRERPVARDFVAAIEDAPTSRARAGWQRIGHIAEVLPGDLFAWRRPRGFPSRNTGHVGFVLDRPLPVPGMPGAYAVRIVDSTSYGHQDDSRGQGEAAGAGGFGSGTLVFLTDGQGHGTHYGWFGTHSPGYVITPIYFGRVSR